MVFVVVVQCICAMLLCYVYTAVEHPVLHVDAGGIFLFSQSCTVLEITRVI